MQTVLAAPFLLFCSRQSRRGSPTKPSPGLHQTVLGSSECPHQVAPQEWPLEEQEPFSLL